MEFGLTRHIWNVEELMMEAEVTPTDLAPLPDPPRPPEPGLLPGRRRFKLYAEGKTRVS